MLSDAEKNKIVLEETYRNEVRETLATNKPQSSSKLVKFLNTNLGMWMISSLVVGLITWGYTEYSNYLKHESQRVENIRKLDIEIKSRLYFLQLGLLSYLEDPAMTLLQMRNISNPQEAKYKINTYDEFGKTGMTGLLWQLESLVTPDAKEEIRQAAEASLQIFEHYNKIQRKIEQEKNRLEKLKKSGSHKSMYQITPDRYIKTLNLGVLTDILGSVSEIVNEALSKLYDTEMIERVYPRLNLKRWNYPLNKFLNNMKPQKQAVDDINKIFKKKSVDKKDDNKKQNVKDKQNIKQHD